MRRRRGLSARARLLAWQYATGYPDVPRSLDPCYSPPVAPAYFMAKHAGPRA